MGTQQEKLHASRLYLATRRAEEVFTNGSAAAEWLNSANLALGGHAPIELLSTDTGFRLVMDALGRIEHGVFP